MGATDVLGGTVAPPAGSATGTWFAFLLRMYASLETVW